VTAIGGAEEVSEKVSGTISTNWQKLSLTPFSDTIFRAMSISATARKRTCPVYFGVCWTTAFEP